MLIASLRGDGALADVHAGYSDPLKETGGNDGAGRIMLQLRLEFRQLVTVLEGVARFPDDVYHEQAAACDAAVELRRDQAWLLSHLRELFFEALQKTIDLIGWHQ